MLYQANLSKEKTYWWDEDMSGSCIFSAKNDEEARQFIATIIKRMNRKYWRIGEQRNAYIRSIMKFEEDGFSAKMVEVDIWNCLKPFQDFKQIRISLEAFFPKNKIGLRHSIAFLFFGFKESPHPNHHREIA